jgi:hypothetical protein
LLTSIIGNEFNLIRFDNIVYDQLLKKVNKKGCFIFVLTGTYKTVLYVLVTINLNIEVGLLKSKSYFLKYYVTKVLINIKQESISSRGLCIRSVLNNFSIV